MDGPNLQAALAQSLSIALEDWDPAMQPLLCNGQHCPALLSPTPDHIHPPSKLHPVQMKQINNVLTDKGYNTITCCEIPWQSPGSMNPSLGTFVLCGLC